MARQLKYDQVRLAILNIIAEDHLQPGDRLPSVRQLLTRIPSCSMITLRKALEMLENESMLSRCIGKGTFLKQNITVPDRNGKILFINVSRKGKNSYLPPGSLEYMQFYFNGTGLDFQYLQVESFSDSILKSLDHVLGIMLYGWLTDDFMCSMKALQIPMLIVGNSPRFSGIPQVELDICASAELAAEQLIHKGAGSLFLVNSNPDYSMHDAISAGIEKTIHKHKNVQFKSMDLTGQNQPEQLRKMIDSYGHYDAWIFELGNYYTYLGTCRYYSLTPHPLIGIVGDCGNISYPGHNLILGSDNTIVTVFRQSIFKEACEQLKGQIMYNIPLTSVSIQPEIENRNDNKESL